MQMTPLGKFVVLILAGGIAIGGWRWWNKLAPGASITGSVIPKSIHLPSFMQRSNSGGSNASFEAPGNDAGCTDKPEVRLEGYAWNAQMGMQLAIGGAQATRGSLMCKHGINMRFARQDDNGKLQEALVAFATDLSQGTANPTSGTHFVTIMGDGGAAFLAGLNKQLIRLGPDYQAKIVDAIGYSRGEDKFMGPAAWKSDPETARGALVAGVVKDGDWNIAQKWCADNGIKSNPNFETWDPDAINWVNASDYIDAAQKYVADYSESRKVVRNGTLTGETKDVKVNGVVTWTPGDVTVAEKKGGLVSIVSTKEYSSQMPCVVIGIDKWMRQNRSTVVSMIQAIAEGSDQVRNSEAALHKGAEIEAVNFNENGADANYWEKYFKGTHEPDATGVSVELGGSSVNNLADSLTVFGLLPGTSNLVANTYTAFGEIVSQQYPHDVPSFPSAAQVIDTSYLKSLVHRASPQAIQKARPSYKARGGRVSHAVVGRRQWHIEFNAGQATFQPSAQKVLQELLRGLLVASGTIVEIHGHTDNQGNPATSMPLSARRANAVKRWLEITSPVNFPAGRIRTFAHGESQPIAPNTSAAGRAKNRRVEIILRPGY